MSNAQYLKNHDVILVSSCNFTLHTKNVLNAQILAQELAQRGVRVLFVESLGLKTLPVMGKTDIFKIFQRALDFIKLLFNGVSNPEHNIYVLSLVRLPFENISLIKTLNEKFITFFVNRFAKKYLGNKRILWMFLPNSNFLVKSVKHDISIYHCVDNYSQVPFVNKEYIKEQEDKMLNSADLIFTVSNSMKEQFQKIAPEKNIIYINNVARFDVFNKALANGIQAPDDLKPIIENGKPNIVFMGNIASYKENLELLAEIATKGSNYNFLLIGPIGSGELTTNIDELKKLSNVYFLGPKDYSELYKYFKYSDIAVINRRINEANEGGFPLKYFEYLAAGLPVVVTGINTLKEFSTQEALGSICNTSDEFLSAFNYWINVKLHETEKWNQLLSKRLEIAKENSWENRMDFLNSTVTKIM